jgi:hypothetical protein
MEVMLLTIFLISQSRLSIIHGILDQHTLVTIQKVQVKHSAMKAIEMRLPPIAITRGMFPNIVVLISTINIVIP